MTDNKPKTENENARDWSTRVGTVKPGSIETFQSKKGEDALRAIVVNADGKEGIIEAFGAPAQEKLRAAAESDKPMVFRGPAYFTEGNVPHVMIATVAPQAEPKAPAPEKTAEQKAEDAKARAEAKAERAKHRTAVDAGSIGLGDEVEVGGVKQAVTHVGKEFEQGGKSRQYVYVGEFGAKMEAEKAAKSAEKDSDPSPM